MIGFPFAFVKRRREQATRREYDALAASHEAAHVVVALALGLWVDEVFIDDSLNGGGMTIFRRSRKVEDEIMVTLAAWEERRLRFGYEDAHPKNHDYRDAFQAALRLTKNSVLADKMLLRLSERVRELLSSRLGQVDIVADALSNRGHLDSKDLAELGASWR